MTNSSLRFRRIGVLLACVATMSAAFTVVGGSTPVSAATEITISQSGPRGAVTVIGDSVLLGAGLYSPTLPEQLSARGWGPIRFRAAGSATSGKFPVANEFRSSWWIDLWQSQGWDPGHVIVNLGVNDSGFCRTSFTCAYDSIMHMVAAIGPGHQIWWPTITKSSSASRDTFNAALQQVAAERADFHVWDWLAEFNAGGYVSGDLIHLDPASYRKRSDRMATEFTNTFSLAQRTGGDAALPAPTSPASTFVAAPPTRMSDTRQTDQRVTAGASLTVEFGDLVGDDATAVALYVAAARPSAAGYLSAGPCGVEPSGATLNFGPGQPTGAPTVTALGDDGNVCIFASAATDVVVDLQGSFVANRSGSKMTPLIEPVRLADTRRTARSDRLEIDVDPHVDAVAVNVAAVRSEAIGYLAAAACDAPTDVATVNFAPGVPTSASAIVPVVDGRFCVTASNAVDIIVDLTATFSEQGALTYRPVPPTRTLDTRDGTGGWQPFHGGGQTIDIGVAPSEAVAVTGTLTAVRPGQVGYATGYGCLGNPPTASVNVASATIAANSLTTAVVGGRMCLFASTQMHTVFDTAGWWVTAE